MMNMILMSNLLHLLVAVGLLYVAYRVQNGAASEYDVYALYALGAVALVYALWAFYGDYKNGAF